MGIRACKSLRVRKGTSGRPMGVPTGENKVLGTKYEIQITSYKSGARRYLGPLSEGAGCEADWGSVVLKIVQPLSQLR